MMGFKFFSDKNRPVHLGPFPLERLVRGPLPDLTQAPSFQPLDFTQAHDPASIINAMGDYQAMMDTIRDGLVNITKSQCPDDPVERANHLKAFGYFNDASMVGIGPLPATAHLESPARNPAIDQLSVTLRTKQTKTLASGIDMIMADLRDAMQAPPSPVLNHTHAIVFLYEHPRDPAPQEPGTDWLADAQAHRAALRATETATVLANYIRVLGYDAKAHSATSTDVDLNQLTVAAGLASIEGSKLCNPFLGDRFGVAVVTTTFGITHDAPLAPLAQQTWAKTKGLTWSIGKGAPRSAINGDPFKKRNFVDGPHPFETLRRVETPTTYIDEPNVPRVPKRADMFARAQFGDMGKAVQKGAAAGHYARKSAPSMAQRRMLGAFILLQDGPTGDGPRPTDPERNALNIKAASYFLGADAVGISRCPDWTWYSHDATGQPIDPPHDQAISMIIDQGFETMEGASGDDWISVAQSMRAYLRFSLLGGVIANHIRNLGYKAKAHSVMDGEVIQPPLLLLAGLGEVSRIGEVILNPFLGPRLKSGVVTTDMPVAHDKPIDFGLQKFCDSCNKCARECPSGAITAGPKKMFNGYEIWKSDSQKCATYRITTQGGAMCGRCMKTCPWNLEGLFAEKPFRWAAMTIPKAAPLLAKLDDKLGRGELNDIKKWWWDIELADDGGYHPTRTPINRRPLQKDLELRFEDQTLAVYPADLAPPPHPYPFPMDREAGIEAYQAMITAEEYQKRQNAGETGLTPQSRPASDAPVVQVVVTKAQAMTPEITKYELQSVDGSDLPEWTAGAHLDIVVTPEYLRQYSMSGDPADRSKYQIGVLKEPNGRGGSKMMHRIFSEGRKVFVSKPINHFPLVENATRNLLMGGGIGITPMIAMAHSLYAQRVDFTLHYSFAERATAGFLDDLAQVPWAANVQFHDSAMGTRADLNTILQHIKGAHVYTCGPERYMSAVIDAATLGGFPENARHLEYFAVPEQPEYENHAFTLRLARSGREFVVPPDQSATDVLANAGVAIDVKCSDGICGVCKCGLVSGDVEHRDFVLSNKQRETSVILCQSRAKTAGAVIEVDL
jgi:reductive dehalogenase